MPGYGYAAAAKAKVAAWTELIHAFLRGRANLARVYVLVDARHGLKPADDPAVDVLGQAAVSYQIVLTKADRSEGARAGRRIAATEAATGQAAGRLPRGDPDLLAQGNRHSRIARANRRLLKERAKKPGALSHRPAASLKVSETPAMSKAPDDRFARHQARILSKRYPTCSATTRKSSS